MRESETKGVLCVSGKWWICQLQAFSETLLWQISIACARCFFSVELYYNMLQLLLVIMHFVICQYLQLPLILLIKIKKNFFFLRKAVMAAKHHIYTAKNNVLRDWREFFSLKCCVIHRNIHELSTHWTREENVTHCILFIHLFNTILLNNYMLGKMLAHGL